MAKQKMDLSKWITLLVVVAVLGGLLAYALTNKSQNTIVEQKTETANSASGDSVPVSLPPSEAPADQKVQATSVAYKNGTYMAAGNYSSPAGAESITVTLTLKDDVVTDATIVGNATAPFSKNWQTKFIAGVKAVVVGQKLDSLNLAQVSGSSLTPKGFNDAVAKIKVQAKA